MYTLLIVDDEALVRNAMSKMIDWESLGFSRILQAEDGRDALRILESEKVNMVMTDIAMPFMDGLELTKIIYEEYADIYIVILTGYGEFEYARKAIKYGVKNYILKPVGAATLYEEMKKICTHLNFAVQQKNYISEMKSQLYRSLPELRENVLYSLICVQESDKEKCMKRARGLDINFLGGNFIVGIVDPDFSEVNNDELELFTFAVKNITMDVIGDKHYIFDDGNNRIIVLFQFEDEMEDIRSIVYATMQVIQKIIFSITDIETTCSLGGIADRPEDLCRSFSQAEKAMECKYSLGSKEVYDIQDIEYVEKSFYYPAYEITELIYAVKFLSREDIISIFEKIKVTIFRDRNIAITNIKMIYIEMMVSILKELSEIKQLSDGIWQHGMNLFQDIQNMQAFDQELQVVLDFAVAASRELQSIQNKNTKTMLNKIQEYVEENYADEELSLMTAADHTGVSTGYLCALFKKEAGTNFVKYLTTVRMNKAKELLITTNKLTYEIAFDTGFSNPHYFSTTFKKCVGITPSEYRERYLKEYINENQE
ncbi:response regulator [Anaerobium acetethylicum]|uniref:Stage 0 sporulation protein A homolog n=1 Tax=Anaerobium acetethylicum TaxID=1619234 RepID=A0A1D3TYU5_9FIRM|nr:response regulator [Anaerobium acetethylicum]SCP99657.1 two-component system, response regulator YesN [Anaerobium acetethylicum]